MEFESQIVKEAAVQVKQPSSHHFLLQAKCCCWVRDNQLHSLNAKWKKATHGSSLQNLAGGIRLQPGNRSKRPQIMFACDQLRHLESKEGMLHVSCQTVSKTQTQTKQPVSFRSPISMLHCRLFSFCRREDVCSRQWTALRRSFGRTIAAPSR